MPMVSDVKAPPKKRGYSRAFTPQTARRVQIVIDRVPPTLKDAAVAKARREGVSLRALILGWLKEWAGR
jgi:predicted HicB family RNase H-like nuclease